MHIKRIDLRQYKRFTKLSVELPTPARLVMMCGPNGTGKSSLLEAMKLWHDVHSSQLGRSGEATYHVKGGVQGSGDWAENVTLEFHEGLVGANDLLKVMYFRTAYRHEPEFTLNQIVRTAGALETKRPGRMIDADMRVSDNYQRLVNQSFDALFGETDETITAVALRERLIGGLRDAVLAVLPDLRLTGVADPLNNGTFRFAKGITDDFPYALLSGGEKAVFDLLLDMLIKSAVLDDPVICIDEPDAHTNPVIQDKLLDAMLNMAGEESQLWLATHSVGMLRRAQELSNELPGQVTFLDFGDKDFDEPSDLKPVPLSREFWKRTIAASLGDIAGLVAPATLVLCEGQPSRGDRAEFDAKCLRAVFNATMPDAEFAAVGNDGQVIGDKVGIGKIVQTVIAGTTIIRLVDRDDRSPDEVFALEREGVSVLGRRNLETYLLDEEVLIALCQSLGKSESTTAVLEARAEAIKSAVDGGKPSDDLKAAKGDIYNSCKQILGLRQAGSSADVFLVEQLAPQIKPGMAIYEELRQAVFG